MRKFKVTAVVFLLLAVMPQASADVYVKVDANGNAVGQAIICDAGTCADGSAYSKATLSPGERYVLQNQGHSGIGNNNPGAQVKVDLSTNQWTATTTTVKEVAPIQVTPQIQVAKVEVVTQTTWNPTIEPAPRPTSKATVIAPTVSLSETSTVTIAPSPGPVATSTPTAEPTSVPKPVGATMTTTQIIKPWFEWFDFDWESFWLEFSTWLMAWDWNLND